MSCFLPSSGVAMSNVSNNFGCVGFGVDGGGDHGNGKGFGIISGSVEGVGGKLLSSSSLLF